MNELFLISGAASEYFGASLAAPSYFNFYAQVDLNK